MGGYVPSLPALPGQPKTRMQGKRPCASQGDVRSLHTPTILTWESRAGAENSSPAGAREPVLVSFTATALSPRLPCLHDSRDLHQSAQAAQTEDHSPGGLNLLTVLGAADQGLKCRQGWFPLRRLSLACRRPSSVCVFTYSPYENTSPVRLGLHPNVMTSC